LVAGQQDKGDNLFRQNDLHGAVGAYTAALNVKMILINFFSFFIFSIL
jgi:hypothetical protein